LNRFGHLDLRVTSLELVMPFYEALLPALGFTRTFHGQLFKAWAAEADLPACPYFAVTEDPNHRPNANRVAFWSPDRADVDRLAEIARGAGAKTFEGPEEVPHLGNYYACWFEDPCGNRFEIYYRTMG
jgi:predicted enzyme related to lactoylglutathione lyase